MRKRNVDKTAGKERADPPVNNQTNNLLLLDLNVIGCGIIHTFYQESYYSFLWFTIDYIQ